LLEPDARKRARPVLRGPDRRKVVGLPGECALSPTSFSFTWPEKVSIYVTNSNEISCILGGGLGIVLAAFLAMLFHISAPRGNLSRPSSVYPLREATVMPHFGALYR